MTANLRAWLARDRSARRALLFCVFLLLLAIFAPFLPLPAPAALDLEHAYAPPFWLGSEESLSPLRKRFALFEEQWVARTLLSWQGETPDPVVAELLRQTKLLSGRKATHHSQVQADGSRRHELHLPAGETDKAALLWQPSGRRGTATLYYAAPNAVGAQVWIVLDLPLETELVSACEAELTQGELRIHLRDRKAPTAHWSYRAAVALPQATEVVGIELNPVQGRALDASAALSPREAWLRTQFGVRGAEQLAAHPAITLHCDAVGTELARKWSVDMAEHHGLQRPHLGARLAAALETSNGGAALPHLQIDCTVVDPATGSSAFDRALLALRARCFGLWQTRAWLGKDAQGRDLLARLIFGSRTSLGVALAAALTSLCIGVSYGAVAGLLGGRLDEWMMRLVDMLYALPFVFVVIFLITVLAENQEVLEGRLGLEREKLLYLVIGAIWWLTMARVVRGQVLALKQAGFVEAARAMGASTWRILRVHIIPHVLPIIVVYLTLTIPQVMLCEAFLSFLGLGIAEPKVSWGGLAQDALQAMSPLRVRWWLVLFPSLALGGTLYALNVLGDGLRDALALRQERLAP